MLIRLKGKQLLVLIFFIILAFGYLLMTNSNTFVDKKNSLTVMTVKSTTSHNNNKSNSLTVMTVNYTKVSGCIRPLPLLQNSALLRTKFPTIKDIPSKMLQNIDPPKEFPNCGFGGIFPWRFGKNKETNELLNHRLVVLVNSAPMNIIRRNLIRSTWGGIRQVLKSKIAVIFVIGKLKDDAKQDLIATENEHFKDLLQCDFIDSYEMLHVKVFSMLKWLHETVPEYDYLAITDDDIAFRIDTAMEYFDSHDQLVYKENVICGFQLSTVEGPSRNKKASNGKWFTSTKAYSGKLYPHYCNGPGYTMTKPMAESLYCVAQLTDFGSFIWEDIIITGILREKLGDGNANIRMSTKRLIEGHSEQAGAEVRMKKAWSLWLEQEKFMDFLFNQTHFEPYDNKNDEINNLIGLLHT